MGRLDIRIIEARNIPDLQTIGKPDPYCIVRCESQQLKTRIIEDSLNPKWDETMKFQIADENSAQVRCELWNHNVVADELIGLYTVSVSGLTKGVESDTWCLLRDCKGGNAEIRVSLLAIDFGKSPSSPIHTQLATGSTQQQQQHTQQPAYVPPPQPQYFQQPQYGQAQFTSSVNTASYPPAQPNTYQY